MKNIVLLTNEERVRKGMKRFDKIVETFVENDERKEYIQKIIDTYGERFFTSPAASTNKGHEWWIGGLVEHSCNVAVFGIKLNKCLNANLSNEQIAFCGLFHDLGKIGDETENYYLPETSQWHRDNLGRMYLRNERLLPIPVSIRSLYLLQGLSIPLTKEEFQAIALHDGPNMDLVRMYENKMKEYDLTLIMQMADRWSIQKYISKNINPEPKEEEIEK